MSPCRCATRCEMMPRHRRIAFCTWASDRMRLAWPASSTTTRNTWGNKAVSLALAGRPVVHSNAAPSSVTRPVNAARGRRGFLASPDTRCAASATWWARFAIRERSSILASIRNLSCWTKFATSNGRSSNVRANARACSTRVPACLGTGTSGVASAALQLSTAVSAASANRSTTVSDSHAIIAESRFLVLAGSRHGPNQTTDGLGMSVSGVDMHNFRWIFVSHDPQQAPLPGFCSGSRLGLESVQIVGCRNALAGVPDQDFRH